MISESVLAPFSTRRFARATFLKGAGAIAAGLVGAAVLGKNWESTVAAGGGGLPVDQVLPTLDPAFMHVWERTDRPVQDGRVARSWYWGPLILQDGFEPYRDAPNHERYVVYFDKSRMELTDPTGARANPFFITNGLLVVEMVSGQVQMGDAVFQERVPNPRIVAGDENGVAPGYAAFRGVTTTVSGEHAAPNRIGQVVTAAIRPNGSVADHDQRVIGDEVRYVAYQLQTHHNIPDVFQAFLQAHGVVWVHGHDEEALLVDGVSTFGYPISEAYWAAVTVNRTVQPVLIQLYQRRVLTYTPNNPPGFAVEAGNVGRHYLAWRYPAAV